MATSSRELFRETMGRGRPERALYFEEGIRDDVLQAWYEQGLAPDADLAALFHTDRREEIRPELEPMPYPRRWPRNIDELAALRPRLDPSDDRRLPADWPQKVRAWRERDYPLLLRVHRGIFQTLGIGGWDRFEQVMCLMVDDPAFVRRAMDMQAEFVCRLIEPILKEIEVDAVIFSEPIGDNNGPLISPRMYEELALASYAPILDLARRYGVETIIFRTYANARALIPSMMRWGFNCLWACEVNIAAMAYADLRREFGRDLRLIGGLDTDVLRQDRPAIAREIEKVPSLLAQGGYIPLADGRIRADIPLTNYLYYRELLARVTAG